MPPKKRTHSKIDNDDAIANKNSKSKSKALSAVGEKNIKRHHTEASHTLYISNLNSKIKPSKMKENLYILFSSYADIIEINYPCKNQRGQGWVVVSSPDDADECVSKLEGFSIFDKPLNVNYAKKDSKSLQQLKRICQEEEEEKEKERVKQKEEAHRIG
ncbi:U2 snRNP complex subunit msl1 [Pichia californica]|uniref:U2 snRNP complex subunit msl1 n=1 Tax=Pichia californica TaxID=460514 RepID=A0A9P6WM91_9ASCO|nr:U2 snRNP complex subunit msl1 [[Candida] californica]KAG0689730.1 U2 snRNP complex subunit msl1 [[Candida] californica]